MLFYDKQKQSPSRYSVKKVFLEISQNLQENTFARVSFLMCFPVNFAKFLGTPLLRNTSGRLLLNKAFCSGQNLNQRPLFP